MARTKAAVVLLLACGAAAPAGAQRTTGGATQRADIVAHSVALTRNRSAIRLETVRGATIELSLTRGEMHVNDEHVATYREGQVLDLAWRGLLGGIASIPTARAVQAIEAFRPGGLNQAETAGLDAFRTAVTGVGTAIGGVARADAPAIAGAAEGAAAVAPVPALPPVPAIPAVPAVPDVEAITRQAQETARRALEEVSRGRTVQVHRVEAAPGGLGLVFSNFLSLLGVFVSLTGLGFGMVFFAPKQLDVVSDTVWHSFRRSFMAGLFAQPLLVPAFAMMIVGLTLTVVGILVIPFAVVAFWVAVVAAVVAGYVGLARSIGEIYLKRKIAAGEARAGTWISLRYIAYGLIGLLAVWLPAVLFSWVPVAGTTLFVLATLITWIVATAGLGASILTRGGVRGPVARRLDHALEDDYWSDMDASSLPRVPSRSSPVGD